MAPQSLARNHPTSQIVKIPTICLAILPMLANSVLPSMGSPRNSQATPIEKRERRPNGRVGLVKSHILPAVSDYTLLKRSLFYHRNGLLKCQTGDDRPCIRCVKRGCQHQCKDGVRKKAKYLEDPRAEASTQELGTRGRPPVQTSSSSLSRQGPPPEMAGTSTRNVYMGQRGDPNPYEMYAPVGPQNLSSSAPFSVPGHVFENQRPIAPHFGVGRIQQPLALQNYNPALQQTSSVTSGPSQISQGGFADDLNTPFDMTDLDHFEFNSHYGATEFQMLGHLASSMENGPPSSSAATFSASNSFTPSTMANVFEQGPVDSQQYPFPPGQAVPSWTNDSQQHARPDTNTSNPSGRGQDATDGLARHEAPPAFAIGSSAYPSPSSGSSPQGMMAGFDDSPTNKNMFTHINQSHQAQARPDSHSHQRPTHSTVSVSTITTPTLKDQTLPSRRHRNPSMIYDSVKQPYSYTTAFHKLVALVQGRFNQEKTARIARALAAIRPSFISCTMKLSKEDLVFMEKCLQRTLWEHEEFISATGTPTIICRRTGEVVAAGKEFSYLTGWTKDILLGKQPNLNAKRGDEGSNIPSTGTSSRGENNPPGVFETKPDTPVNIVSLLDDDSACQFFEDYAELAFGDSRGTVTTPCKLLRYRTMQDIDIEPQLDDELGSRAKQRRDANLAGKGGIRGEAGMHQSGQEDGTIDCMTCWSVKRDVFDIPMLVVMNVRTVLKVLYVL